MNWVLAIGIAITGTAPAADKKIELRYFGQSFFVLTTPAGTRIAIDPHAIDQLGGRRPTPTWSSSAIRTRTTCGWRRSKTAHRKGAGGHQGAAAGSGGRPTSPELEPGQRDVPRREDPQRRHVSRSHAGPGARRNSVFIFEVEGLRIVHLGDLGHALSDDQIQQIGPVDVLMIPVGGVFTLNGDRAKEVMAQLKPRRIVVPMHYGVGGWDDVLPVDEFLDGQRTSSARPAPISSPSTRPRRRRRNRRLLCRDTGRNDRLAAASTRRSSLPAAWTRRLSHIMGQRTLWAASIRTSNRRRSSRRREVPGHVLAAESSRRSRSVERAAGTRRLAVQHPRHRGGRRRRYRPLLRRRLCLLDLPCLRPRRACKAATKPPMMRTTCSTRPGGWRSTRGSAANVSRTARCDVVVEIPSWNRNLVRE